MSRPAAFAALLLAAHAMLAWVVQARKTVAPDEAFTIAQGAAYWRGGLGAVPPFVNPPLAPLLMALPLLPLRLTPPAFDWQAANPWEAFRSARDYLYQSGLPDPILRRSRAVALAAGLLTGFVVWRWAGALWGERAGLTALALWAFCPTAIAYSGLATTDMLLTAWFVAAAFLWWRYLCVPSVRGGVLAGAALGCALATKLTADILLPSFVAAWLWARRGRFLEAAATEWRALAVAGAAAVAVLCAAYGVVHVWDHVRLHQALSAVTARPLGTFFNGQWRTGGVAVFYASVLAMKLTLPALILIGASAWPSSSGAGGPERPAYPLVRDPSAWVGLLVPAAALFLAGSLAPYQHGIRYMLPAMALLYIWAARARLPGWLLAALLLWHASAPLRSFPHLLPYMNEAWGGYRGAWRYLIDSNTDWGQEVRDLRSWLAGTRSECVLSYFGVADLEKEGIAAQLFLPSGYDALHPGRHVNSARPTREVLAISASHIWGMNFWDDRPVGWLRARTPAAQIGGSLLIYDITTDREAHERLAAFYSSTGRDVLARHERARARALK